MRATDNVRERLVNALTLHRYARDYRPASTSRLCTSTSCTRRCPMHACACMHVHTHTSHDCVRTHACICMCMHTHDGPYACVVHTRALRTHATAHLTRTVDRHASHLYSVKLPTIASPTWHKALSLSLS